ncbi:MAG: hypothetical protein M3H12_03605, partial [Chromatiales bacterium]
TADYQPSFHSPWLAAKVLNEGSDCDSCRDDDDDFCYRRWEREDSACGTWKAKSGIRAVKACQYRAADRRNLCVNNGGETDPDGPGEYGDEDLF